MFYGHSYDGSFVFWGESRVLSREKQAPGHQQWLSGGFPQLPILQFLSATLDRTDIQMMHSIYWTVSEKNTRSCLRKIQIYAHSPAEPAWSCASLCIPRWMLAGGTEGSDFRMAPSTRCPG